MNHPVTKVLAAVPPAMLGAGFAIRTLISNRPPVSIVRQLQDLSFAWAIILELLCLAAVALAFVPNREWSIKLRSVVYFALTCWAVAIVIAVFLREPDASQTPQPWLATREYTTIGAGLAVAAFFLGAWWNEVHFRLGELQARRELSRQIEEDH